MGKQFLELTIQLTSQRLVVGKHKSRTVHPFNDIGHRKGLAGSGSTFQHLFLFSFLQAFAKGINGFGLITSRLEW